VLTLAEMTWLTRFRPFTTFHFVVAALCIAAMIAACLIGRSIRGTPAERRFRTAWIVSIILFQLAAFVWWFWPTRFVAAEDLPLHLCRIVVWIAAVALATSRPLPRALLYFWGLGLCFQGFVTPLRLDGLQHPYFWIFWVGHLQIVGSAVYDVVVLGYRPTMRDFGLTFIASLAFMATVIPLNVAFGWDYAYLGQGPYRTRNVIDMLPAWPWRPFWLFVIGQLMMFILLAVWQFPALRRAKPEAELAGESA
jgi:hypothetical integral membrane protein (TIGR02206 family)